MKRDQVLMILEAAAAIDKDLKISGASTHKYRLNDPIAADFVRNAEEKYGFMLPEDYFRFITEIGDGGACENYGLYSFREYITKNGSGYEKKRYNLGLPFDIKLLSESRYANDFPFNDEAVKNNPEKYFVYEPVADRYTTGTGSRETQGFLGLGSRGCQFEYGLAVTGKYKGCVFDTDNMGYYILLADSFDEFYGCWLNKISDTAWLKEQIELWTKI
ncbi:MAG: hypothetical protein K2N56_05535 [Oscillospiraceae bacterium]|nr:hypothetical protein [Oscillospiraceae bacterium]